MKIESNFTGNWKDLCPFCGEPQLNHRIDNGEFEGVHYLHRKPCTLEQEVITQRYRREALTTKSVIFVGWILIPLFVVIMGFASVWVGILLFILSLTKIYIEFIKLFGKADKWLPGHKEKMEKERKMAHYYYHCEQNPEGFRKLFIENLSHDRSEDIN
jgi:hypothetical protein